MSKCSVPFCKSRKIKGNGLSFHEFPAKLKVRTQWLRFISLDKSKITDGINCGFICCLHFTSDDFYSSNNRRRLKRHAVPSIFLPYDKTNTSTAKHEKCKFENSTSRESALKRMKIDVSQIADQVSENVPGAGILLSVPNTQRYLKENAVPSIFPPYAENSASTTKNEKCELGSCTSGARALKRKEIDVPQTDDQVSENITDAELLSLVGNSRRRLKENAVPSIFLPCAVSNTPAAKHDKCEIESRTSAERALKQMESDVSQTDDHVSENIADAELLVANSHFSEPAKNFIDLASKSTQTNYNIIEELEKRDDKLRKLKEKMQMLTTKFQSVRKRLNYYETNDCHQAVERIMRLEENEDNERARFLTGQIRYFF